MALLGRTEVLDSIDHDVCVVKGVWGGDLKVRSMTVTQLFQFNTMLTEARRSGDYTACHVWVCIWCAVDANDNPLFTDKDYQAIAKKSQKSLTKIFSAVIKMNTITEEKTESLKKSSKKTP